jgi:hypothetical protein
MDGARAAIEHDVCSSTLVKRNEAPPQEVSPRGE